MNNQIQKANFDSAHCGYIRPLACLLHGAVGSSVKQAMQGSLLAQAMRAVSDPWTIVMIVLLLLNDHVLRIYWPSWWTGKLGDFTWLAFAPLIVAIPFAFFFPSRTSAQSKVFGLFFVVATGIIFAAIKVLPAAHATFELLFESLIGYRNTVGMDPTDLITIPGLVIAFSIWNRNRISSPTSKRLSISRSLVLITLGSFASVATVDPVEIPCDREVTETEWNQIVAAAQSNPFVSSLSESLHITEIDTWGKGRCWVNERVEVPLNFNTPLEYSSYGISYSTSIHMEYWADGSIQLSFQYVPDEYMAAADQLANILDGIEQLEQHECFRETYKKLGLEGDLVFTKVQWNHIEFVAQREYEDGTASGHRMMVSMKLERDPETSIWELTHYKVPNIPNRKTFPELESCLISRADLSAG